MTSGKQLLVNSFIKFLRDEQSSDVVDEEKKDSLEVAIQCLETIFEVTKDSYKQDSVDLMSWMSAGTTSKEVTDEQKYEAEIYKAKGNDFMKTHEYQKAIVEYTKAIELNPYNAVYFCNRAAAYTRLMQDIEAIKDCKEAIKLDPTYGKSYGRMGIAYSNLNKYDLALEAYELALKYDPTNELYETNLKIAKERLNFPPTASSPFPTQLGSNFAELFNNPSIMNMASQVINDQNFQNMVSALIGNASQNSGGGIPGTVETMLQASQVIAQSLANDNPNLSNVVSQGTEEQPAANPSGEDSTTKKSTEKNN